MRVSSDPVRFCEVELSMASDPCLLTQTGKKEGSDLDHTAPWCNWLSQVKMNEQESAMIDRLCYNNIAVHINKAKHELHKSSSGECNDQQLLYCSTAWSAINKLDAALLCTLAFAQSGARLAMQVQSS